MNLIKSMLISFLTSILVIYLYSINNEQTKESIQTEFEIKDIKEYNIQIDENYIKTKSNKKENIKEQYIKEELYIQAICDSNYAKSKIVENFGNKLSGLSFTFKPAIPHKYNYDTISCIVVIDILNSKKDLAVLLVFERSKSTKWIPV